jgi:hypothetical protein
MIKIRSFLLVFICFFFFSSFAQNAHVAINILAGKVLMVDSTEVTYKAFSSDTILDKNRQLFSVMLNDNVQFKFVNRDSIAHNVFIESWIEGINIPAFSTADTTIICNKTGVFSVEDIDENERYLGLSGSLVVSVNEPTYFYWNLKELQSSFSNLLDESMPINFNEYQPNYFMINGRSNPDIGLDSLAKIRGKVGDTLRLVIHNGGNSVHSLHFHGYHFKIISSNLKPFAIGWEKDTYAVLAGENVVVEIVPDKPGEYPVHDHNLVATTANNIYPNGMFTTLVITP